ncbi:MAG TPA: ATP-binding cassette domain-containing protein [Nitriliruptoraceae bacterium]|nr:ATP-binding cassette domain-containing protein [Nitriliruptoraceae bacterium]
MTTISVSHLTKRFGPTLAVDDLSFHVRPGVVTGFPGPNGADKSTTMRMLLGLVRPTSGDAVIGGVPYADLPDPPGTVGALLEADAFHPARSGRAHLEILAAASGRPRQQVDDVLARVGLVDAADRAAGGYSLGMRQRLGIAGALLADPSVLILDEPANGLDPQGVRGLRSLHGAVRAGSITAPKHLMSARRATQIRAHVAGLCFFGGG